MLRTAESWRAHQDAGKAQEPLWPNGNDPETRTAEGCDLICSIDALKIVRVILRPVRAGWVSEQPARRRCRSTSFFVLAAPARSISEIRVWRLIVSDHARRRDGIALDRKATA